MVRGERRRAQCQPLFKERALGGEGGGEGAEQRIGNGALTKAQRLIGVASERDVDQHAQKAHKGARKSLGEKAFMHAG